MTNDLLATGQQMRNNFPLSHFLAQKRGFEATKNVCR